MWVKHFHQNLTYSPNRKSKVCHSRSIYINSLLENFLFSIITWISSRHYKKLFTKYNIFLQNCFLSVICILSLPSVIFFFKFVYFNNFSLAVVLMSATIRCILSFLYKQLSTSPQIYTVGPVHGKSPVVQKNWLVYKCHTQQLSHLSFNGKQLFTTNICFHFRVESALHLCAENSKSSLNDLKDKVLWLSK